MLPALRLLPPTAAARRGCPWPRLQPGLALCSVVHEGKTYYGTWVKGGCRYYVPALGGKAQYNGYSCSCYNPVATILTWNATAACAVGEPAGAEAPAVCRVTKAGGGDFRFGWWQNNKCFVWAEGFGPAGAPARRGLSRTGARHSRGPAWHAMPCHAMHTAPSMPHPLPLCALQASGCTQWRGWVAFMMYGCCARRRGSRAAGAAWRHPSDVSGLWQAAAAAGRAA